MERLRVKTTNGEPDVQCFIEDMERFFEVHGAKSFHRHGVNVSVGI